MSKDVIVGITGSRYGMNEAQAAALAERFDKLAEGLRTGRIASVTVLHGDCYGVDEEADAMAIARGFARACHPGNITGWRAHTGAEEWSEPAHPWVRNPRIVKDCGWLIAMPCPESRGTWMTWNFATDMNRKRTLLHYRNPPWNSWEHAQKESER